VAPAKDWPQWGGQDGRNMVSEEKGLPESFAPGEKNPKGGGIDLATTKNVKWVAKLGTMSCSTPAVAGGKVFIGTASEGQGVLLCLDEQTGKLLWQLTCPPRDVPKVIDGRKFWFSVFPPTLGICSSPAVDGDRVYVVTQRCEVLCLDVNGLTNGNDGPFQDEKRYASKPSKETGASEAGEADVLWLFDMWDLGVRPADACNCSVLVHGDMVYVCTSNGVDRDADASKRDEFRKPPAPLAPNLIVLQKKTGRLVATDEEPIASGMLHGQWSSPSLGRVGDKTLVFLGGGDGACYAWEALSSVPEKPVKLKKAWSLDCNPPEYKVFGDLDLITHYSRGDRRRKDTIIGKNDGTFAGMSEIIATPVFHNDRVYVAIGRDPEHGRGRGALWCLDAGEGARGPSRAVSARKGSGFRAQGSEPGRVGPEGFRVQGSEPGRVGPEGFRVQGSGAKNEGSGIRGQGAGGNEESASENRAIWCYKGLDRTLSTVSIADGLLYVADVAGRLHCLDADTGRCVWIHETKAKIWGSTLVADGKVYLPTEKHLWVLAAGREKRVLNQISLGAPVWATPIAANGVLYVASTRYLWAIRTKD
jgi:outer membrane protein assembly factor BamB